MHLHGIYAGLLLIAILLWLNELPEAASIPEHESVKNKTLTLGVLAAYDFVGYLFVVTA